MVFWVLGSRSTFLEGVMETCKIFIQKDNSSIPHIKEMFIENMQSLSIVCSILQQMCK